MHQLITLLKGYITHKDRHIKGHATALLKRLQELNPQDTVRCNNCYTIYEDRDGLTCTKCNTDAYLMDNYTK
jgi:uncharacterized paraquat-inducible protein A